MSEGPVIATVKVERYSSNSGKLMDTYEEKLLLEDAGQVAKLDFLLSLLHGEWDEYYVTHRPATCGDCKHHDKEGNTCAYTLKADAANPACQFFKLRDD